MLCGTSMELSCCIRSCRNFKRYDPTLQLYPVPYADHERALWAKAFSIPVESLTPRTRVCADHFMRKSQSQNSFDHTVRIQRNAQVQILRGADWNKVLQSPGSPLILPPDLNKTVNSVPATVQTPDANDVQTSNFSATKSILSCELQLECHEENLSQVQQTFQSQEWLNYVQFNTAINNLSSITAVNGSTIGERIPSGLATPAELPLLIFSNAGSQPQAILMPFLSNSVASNAPRIIQMPPRPDLSVNISNSAPIEPKILSSTQCNVFPVKLDKVPPISSEKNTAAPVNEEIFPLVVQDSLHELVNTAKPNISAPSALVPASVEKAKSNDLIIGKSNDLPKNGVGRPPSPSSDSENSRSLSPDLLNNLEVSFHETDSNSVPFSTNFSIPTPPNPPANTDATSDDSNGPRIVDVVSGKEGANEYYKSDYYKIKVVGIDAENKNETDNGPTQGEGAPTMPKTVTQWSIFSMQKTIAVISTGLGDVNIQNILGIRPHIPPASVESDAATALKNRLREENFMTLSVWWLIKKRYLPLNPPCSKCGTQIFRIQSCNKFPDNLCWTCDKCSLVSAIKRPKFFERFPSLTLEELLLLTYHWACKSPLWVIKKDVPISDDDIYNYFIALQQACGEYVNKYCAMGKSARDNITVEVSVVKLGKFFVLCAYDRKNKVSRLQTLTTEQACGTIKHIKVLETWITSGTIITWKGISEEFLPGILKLGADPAVTNVLSSGRHILNASKYLGKTMLSLFQNLNHDQLTLDLVQGYLNEVEWRERYGRIEESAFWNILNEISRWNDTFYTEAVLGEITSDRYFYQQDVTFQVRWGPYEIGSKTSSSYHVPENISHGVKEAISTCVAQTTLKVQTSKAATSSVPSTSKAFAVELAAQKEERASKKSKHPISVFVLDNASLAPPPHTRESMHISSQDLLSITITFSEESSYLEALQSQALHLGQKLKGEGFLTAPVGWLVKNNFIGNESKCYICNGKAKMTVNAKFPDGVSWVCTQMNCKFENEFKRPSFFANFGFRLGVVFAIVYHWAVQSDYKTVSKSIPLNEFKIICVHRKLQSICSEAIKRPSCKIGGPRHLIEVALVKFANCFILGALERESKFSRYKAFSVNSKLHIDEIRKTLISWLLKDSTVIVNSNKYFGQYCMEERVNLVFSDKSITDMSNKHYHTLTISNYLQNHMKKMFGTMKVQFMSAELLQSYLDELVWRERYGRSPVVSFRSIFRDIFYTEYKGVGLFPSGCYRPNVAQSNVNPPVLTEVKVVLERLPDHILKRYLPDDDGDDDDNDDDVDDDITIIEESKPAKKIKVEVILDDDDDDDVNDEVEILKLVTNFEMSEKNPENSLESSSSGTILEKMLVSSSETYPEKSLAPSSPGTNLEKSLTSSSSGTNLEKYLISSTSNLEKSFAPSSFETNPEKSVISSISGTNPEKSLASSSSGTTLEKSLTPLSSITVQSEDSSSTSSSSVYNVSDAISVPQKKIDLQNYLAPIKLVVNKSQLIRKRYSEKCYSHRRAFNAKERAIKTEKSDIQSTTSEESDIKFHCIECKEHVWQDHFIKIYSCDDCKRQRYTTYCQKAFAQHRAYVLFGKKAAQSNLDMPLYHRKIRLPQPWYCSCGYASLDGNKIASHLVKCEKTTCYVTYDDPISVDPVSDDPISVL